MFPQVAYLDWAIRHYGKVPFDLATSGIPGVGIDELGTPAKLDDPAGWSALVRAIARFSAVAEDEITPANGCTHAVWLAYAAILSPGDDALIEAPAYEPLLRMAEGLGANVVRFDRVGDGFALDPANVARAITNRTKLVVVTDLHNPGGRRADRTAIAEIAKVAAARGAYLLVDEVYAPFDALTDGAGRWPGTSRRIADNVVAASSLTKCFGLGPHRIGWMIAPGAIAARARDALVATCGHLSAPHANIGAHAFAEIERLAARARRELGRKRARVEAWIAGRPDLAWSAPDAGLFGFVTVTTRGDEDLFARIERGAKEHGVLVAAGRFFERPNGFRLAWSIDDAKLDEGLRRLDRVIPSLR